MSDRARPIVPCLLLAFGAQIWLVVGQGAWGSDTLLFLAIALTLCPVVAPLRPVLVRLSDALHPPTPRARGLAALAIALASGVYLLFTATRQGRTFAPASHDEFMYLLQARLLTAGRLWMPAHPLADFFDTFYVFVKPVYAPLGWPGTALLLAPVMWMGLPHWLVPLAASATSVGLMYSIVTQLVDGLAGAIGSLALLALPALESTWRGSSTGVALAIAALCIGSLPQLDRHRDDGFFVMPAMDFSVRTLPRIIRRPALVLFRFRPGLNVHDEPVYNIDMPNPDVADIVRAHDLGPDKNREIIEYYGRRQPDRHVYVVDRADLSCTYVGRAGDLWRELAAPDGGAAPSAATTKPAAPSLIAP